MIHDGLTVGDIGTVLGLSFGGPRCPTFDRLRGYFYAHIKAGISPMRAPTWRIGGMRK